MLNLSREAVLYSSSFIKVAAVAGLFFLATCSSQPDADGIIDRAIAVHGGDHFENMRLEFDFRDIHYVAQRKGGIFEYQRIFDDSLGKVQDVFSNEGFIRKRNDEIVPLDEESINKYTSSVNSVIYFALLPFGLNDAAVNKQYLGETMINDQPYYEVLVNFDQQGGGEDHEDTYVYWIHQQNFTMDYLAYAYLVEGGGTRFREAVNSRTVKGIRFADYVNYTYKGDSVDLDTYENLLQENKLEVVSRIELKNIKVENI